MLFFSVSVYSQRTDTVFYSSETAEFTQFHTELAKVGIKEKKVILPIIFHIWDNPERHNYIYISDSIIDSQLEVLNRDFDPLGIQFVRSIINGSSEPIDGVIRYDVPLENFNDGGFISFNYIASTGNDSRMRQTSEGFDFINFHVGPVIGVLGLAFGNGSKEGVLITSPVFGIRPEQTAFGLGRTGTHEIGHWLGLYHTFRGGCGDGSGDEVADTPPVDSQFGCGWSGCNNFDDTNYMNYHDDRCMDHFTQGQLDRMYSIIITNNPFIIQSPGAGYLRCRRVVDMTYATDTVQWSPSLINESWTVRVRRGVSGAWRTYHTSVPYFDMSFIPEDRITYYEVKVKARCSLNGKTNESNFKKKSFVR